MSDISTIPNSDTSDITVVSVTYTTAQCSKVLNVQESTLRKYCSLMQKNGYEFHKNKAGHRTFFDKDIEVFRNIVDLKNTKGFTVEKAVKTALTSDIADIASASDTSDVAYTKLLEEFTTFKEQQQRFNDALLRQLQTQQDYIKKSLEERDKKLMLSMRETLEVQKQIASTKQKKWWKFWK